MLDEATLSYWQPFPKLAQIACPGDETVWVAIVYGTAHHLVTSPLLRDHELQPIGLSDAIGIDTSDDLPPSLGKTKVTRGARIRLLISSDQTYLWELFGNDLWSVIR
jgi:hypothetical protein